MSRFKQDNAPHVFEIEQRIRSIQQGSLDVSSYYTELITLWEEYKNYVEFPLCTCGKCDFVIGCVFEILYICFPIGFQVFLVLFESFQLWSRLGGSWRDT